MVYVIVAELYLIKESAENVVHVTCSEIIKLLKIYLVQLGYLVQINVWTVIIVRNIVHVSELFATD
jgi:hypothetical protein